LDPPKNAVPSKPQQLPERLLEPAPGRGKGALKVTRKKCTQTQQYGRKIWKKTRLLLASEMPSTLNDVLYDKQAPRGWRLRKRWVVGQFEKDRFCMLRKLQEKPVLHQSFTGFADPRRPIILVAQIYDAVESLVTDSRGWKFTPLQRSHIPTTISATAMGSQPSCTSLEGCGRISMAKVETATSRDAMKPKADKYFGM
jgi:hypothetical protein